MERLTKREPNNGLHYQVLLCKNDRYGILNAAEYEPELALEAIEKLAAYEDSGLTPERVAELAKAEAEGRLVVLPCKVGDTAYILGTTLFGDDFQIFERKVDEIRIHADSHGIVYQGQKGGSMTHKDSVVDFGKTVFFTREEAEAALAEKKGVKNG